MTADFLTAEILAHLGATSPPGALRAAAACRGHDPQLVVQRLRVLEPEPLGALAAATSAALEQVASRLFPDQVQLRPGVMAGQLLAAARQPGTWVAVLDLGPSERSVARGPHLPAWDLMLAERDPVAAVLLEFLRSSRGRLQLGPVAHQGVATVIDAASLLPCDADLAAAGVGFQRIATTYALLAHDSISCHTAAQQVAGLLAGSGWQLAASRICGPADPVSFAGVQLAALEPAPQPRCSLYLERPDTDLVLHSGNLLVKQGDQVVSKVALAEVGRVVATTRVGLSSAVVHALTSNRIALTCLDSRGRRAATLVGGVGTPVQHLLAQVDASRDPQRALPIARAVIGGKIAHSRVLARRLARRLNSDADTLAQELGRLAGQLPGASSSEAIMGVEGAASRAYFQFLAAILPASWRFRGRVRRPPTDPVNSMLSLGYTLLAAEAETACQAAGMDPRIGLLHATGGTRPSLALDLMEEFRPLVVDNLVLSLVTGGRMQPEDFDTRPGTPGCWLAPRARPLFFGAYERRMAQRCRQPGMGPMTYRQALHRQAQNLARAICDPAGEYRHLEWR